MGERLVIRKLAQNELDTAHRLFLEFLGEDQDMQQLGDKMLRI